MKKRVNVLSYSLFEMKQIRNHRVWDKNKKDPMRYWYNIPSIIISNDILYPECETRFFVDPHSKSGMFSSILRSNFLKAYCVETPFTHTEPSIWRMIPLWDEDIHSVNPRDIDSIPNTSECIHTKYFIESDSMMMTMRSHENHYHEMGCDILAGLCGFKSDIPHCPLTFKSYWENKNNDIWALDQYLIINTFLRGREDYLKDNFMDCPIDHQSRECNYPCIEYPVSGVNNTKENLTDIQRYVLDINDQLTIWAGEPVDGRKQYLRKLFETDTECANEYRKKIEGSTLLSDFYLN